jgi:bla regulator protein BlaR1
MEAILNNLTKAIGWSIFHSLWQGAIIYGLLILAFFLLPQKRARLKHNLAYGAMCLMFLTFVTSFLILFKLPSPETIAPVGLTQGQLYEQYLATLPASLGKQTELLFPYIVTIYAIGLVIQLFMLSAGYRKLQLLKQGKMLSVPVEWTESFENLKLKLGLGKHIDFHLSNAVNVPLVIGYFKPLVLFPVALVTQLDLKQVEAILIHELSHIRRNDYLLNLIKTGIETILFFNPFVWLGSKLIHMEREHACDDLVLEITETPLTYAHALLKLEIIQDHSSPSFAMAATGKGQHLYQRIKRITDMKTSYINAKQRIFAITLTIATVVSLAWVKPAKTEVQQKPVVHARSVALKQPPMSHSIPITTADDTTKKKKRFKIVTIDHQGKKCEYNSLKEMPDSLRKIVIRETFSNTPDFQLNIDSLVNHSLSFLKSPEWKANLDNAMNAANLANTANVEKINARVNAQISSADWKKVNAELKKSTDHIKTFFNSPEWKKQQEKITQGIAQVEKNINSEEINRQIQEATRFNISISKEKAKELRLISKNRQELESSKEYKDLKKKFDDEVKALRKRKALDTDSTGF